MARRSAPRGSAARRSPCSNRPPSPIPGNKALLAGYGRALADNGNFQQSFDVLTRAHSPDNPDWRILSVQGTVLDHWAGMRDARRYYAQRR
jgi:Flp pilus assembly protein TadD